MAQAVELVRSEHTARTADEILRAPVTALLGVSPAAASALATVGIASVFDLAASRVFSAARRLASLAEDGDRVRPESQLGVVPADTVDAPAGVAVSELSRQPIAILRGIGASRAPAVAAALDVATVRDLALWPPSLAARAILADAFFPDRADGFDPDAPADLLPATGNYPTERVFYRTLLIDGPIAAPANAAAIEQIGEAIDILPGLLAPTGFQQVATGALVTFSQSWFSQGLTLGQLLHSTALAPGESTRLAMIDWTRQSSASTTESIDENERLSNTQVHNRALTEVTSAASTELQQGSSTSTVDSSTSQSGGGFGLDIGPLALGGSGGTSTTTTDAMSASSSFGVRDMAADYAQRINDRTQQHSSSSRSRRASIVREVSQQEHETISTRVVTNYNHMHALTVQYYEVVQAFRTTTQLERTERCLFLPVTLLNFSDLSIVERWRVELGRGALAPAIGRALAELGSVRVVSLRPRRTLIATHLLGALTLGGITLRAASLARTDAEAAATTEGEPAPAAAAPVPEPYVASSTSRIVRLAQAGWHLDQIERLGRLSGRLLVPSRTSATYLSDDALLLGVSLRGGQALKFSVERRDGIALALSDVTGTSAAITAPVAITEVASIAVEHAGTQAISTSLTLQLSLFGTVAALDVPIDLAAGGPESGLQECVRIELPTGTRDLVDHLQANALHYTQAVLRSLDGPAISSILARFTFRGLPLAQLVDQRPVAVTSNLLVFRMNMPSRGDAPDPRLAEDLTAWRAFLARTGLDRPVPKTEIVPLPSGGVFAEAVLGRFNAAERIDLQRFWNWQDSPIPIVASEISPVEAGTRSQVDDLVPGQLSAPVVTIQNPTALPDPTGMAVVVAALQNGNAFRDMSGLAQTAALAQAAQTASAAGATAVARQASQNLETAMTQQTERLRIAAQVAATLMGVPAAGAGGGKPPAGKNTVTERGGELRQAAALDAKQADSPETAAASTERQTFQNQLGIKGRKLAGAVLEAAGIPPSLLDQPAPPAPATRSVGPTLAAPQAIAFNFQLSSLFRDGTVFAPGVTLAATVKDVGGKGLFAKSGPAVASMSGTLNSSDEQLALELRYTYHLLWPQARDVSANSFMNLKAPAGTRRIDAAAIVVAEQATIDVPAAGTAVGDDASLANVLTGKGIELGKVLTKPTVTPRAGGGFDITFRILRNVALQQFGAAPA